MSKEEWITYGIIMPIIMIVVFFVVHNAFIYNSKVRCEHLGGKFTVIEDSIIQTTVCEYSQSVEIRDTNKICIENGKVVDCE